MYGTILSGLRQVEDICLYCYFFANRHRYEGKHSGNHGDDSVNKGDGDNNGLGLGKGKGNEGDANGNGDKDIANLASRRMTIVDLNPLESALTKEEEERELMLLEAVVHIKMARAQRALYQS
jgi:hypothetical protein